MSLQHWWTAASTTAMPVFAQGFGAGYGSALQLRRLFWQETAGMLVGQFQLEPTDYALTAGGTYGRALLHKIWRDGALVQWPLLQQQQGFFYSPGAEPRVVQCSDGRVGRGIGGAAGQPQPFYDDLLVALDPPAGLYELDRLWPGDMTTTRLGTVSWTAPHGIALLFPSARKALSVGYPAPLASNNDCEIRENSASASTLRFVSNGTSYRHARDIVYLTSSTIGILFRQTSAGGADLSLPALLRVFDITSTAYTVLWEDTLPGTDAVAAYDAQRQILYSAPKFAPITLHASRPKRAPTYFVGPSLTSDTVLRSLGATRVQVTVQDARSANISSTLVRWDLVSQASGGFLTSAYGLTNASGVAYTVYAGPVLSGALTETISATVANVE